MIIDSFQWSFFISVNIFLDFAVTNNHKKMKLIVINLIYRCSKNSRNLFLIGFLGGKEMNKKDLSAVLLASVLGGAAFVVPVLADETTADPQEQTVETTSVDDASVVSNEKDC